MISQARRKPTPRTRASQRTPAEDASGAPEFYYRFEGFELNLLGLTFGINPFDLSLRLPLIGRLGPARAALLGSAGPPPRP